MEVTPVSVEAVEQAARDLAPYLPPTPLQPSRAFSKAAGCDVYLKLESVQPIRSFKLRGALNKILRMDPADRVRGFITASAGNAGQGVAYAAMTFGAPAVVYVPESANPLKVDAIRRLGAEVVAHGRSYHEAYLEARRVQGERTFLHAYEDPDVVSGQGTVGVELLAQLDRFDTVLVPVGGGGLIAGVAGYLKQVRPELRVLGVEPVGAACLKRSLEAGHPVTLESVDTIADGLAGSRPGDIAFEVAKRWVEDVLLVEDEEMVDAIGRYFAWEHLLTEPAGAASMAALLNRYRPAPEERVVVIVSGANVTREVMARALELKSV